MERKTKLLRARCYDMCARVFHNRKDVYVGREIRNKTCTYNCAFVVCAEMPIHVYILI